MLKGGDDPASQLAKSDGCDVTMLNPSFVYKSIRKISVGVSLTRAGLSWDDGLRPRAVQPRASFRGTSPLEEVMVCGTHMLTVDRNLSRGQWLVIYR